MKAPKKKMQNQQTKIQNNHFKSTLMRILIFAYLLLFLRPAFAQDSILILDTVYADATTELDNRNGDLQEEAADFRWKDNDAYKENEKEPIPWSFIFLFSLIFILVANLVLLFISVVLLFALYLLCSAGVLSKNIFHAYYELTHDKGRYPLIYKLLMLIGAVSFSLLFGVVTYIFHWIDLYFSLGWGAIVGIIIGLLLSVWVLNVHKHLSAKLKDRL